MKLITFDIETWGLEPGYALQPWRVKTLDAGVMSIAAYDGAQTLVSKWCPPLPDLAYTVDKLTIPTEGKVLLGGWNLKFDLSFLLASGLKQWAYKYKFLDGMLLLKRFRPGLFTYNLKGTLKAYRNALTAYEEDYDDFIQFKPGDPNIVYTDLEQEEMLRYNQRDAIYTHQLISYFLKDASKADINQAIKESTASVLFADIWRQGLNVDKNLIKNYEEFLCKKLYKLDKALEKFQLTPKIIRSSRQLSEYVQNNLKIMIHRTSKTGLPSVDKKNLTNLYQVATGINKKILQSILVYKELRTELDKFVQGFKKATTEENLIYPEPVLNGTYTGRMTYGMYQNIPQVLQFKNGKTRVTNKRIAIGVPMHQIKKKGYARHLLIAPKSHHIVELDFAAQEMRLIACIAEEDTMIELFNDNKDLHAYTAAGILGISYEEFLTWQKSKPQEYNDNRFLGKLTNLALQYRLGAKSLYRQWHDVYGLVHKTEHDAFIARKAYLTLYPKIQCYWNSNILLAKTNNYIENKAGRRYPLTRWTLDNEWKSSQTAINFPIQSTGADQKILAIYCLKDFLHQNSIKLAWDLHDGLYFYMPQCPEIYDNIQKMIDVLENLPYEKAWGWKPQLKFPVEAKIGKKWGELKKVEKKVDKTF